jgi:hypothetical protein
VHFAFFSLSKKLSRLAFAPLKGFDADGGRITRSIAWSSILLPAFDGAACSPFRPAGVFDL